MCETLRFHIKRKSTGFFVEVPIKINVVVAYFFTALGSTLERRKIYGSETGEIHLQDKTYNSLFLVVARHRVENIAR